MLFSSLDFVVYFLPVVLVVTLVLQRLVPSVLARMLWLAAASIFFYGFWNPPYAFLLLGSITVNFSLGRLLEKRTDRVLLAIGVAINLAALGYFKYTDFFIASLNGVFGISQPFQQIALPLAISFFTFQQIAYLVDVYQGKAKDHTFWHYVLFVSFFPQLIAGPIVHHAEMMPQFDRPAGPRLSWRNVLVGGGVFCIGLYKKLVFADGIAIYVDPVYTSAASDPPAFFEAWSATAAYAFQIYFDFSGYSDMAVGLARMFGVVLPINFCSPYKASSIADFWRRWHITLSRFFRDYLYIPMGGNQVSISRQIVNVLTVMFLAGLWHGAGWTFVVWGILHGVYLGINYGWRAFCRRWQWSGTATFGDTPTGVWLGRVLTFLAVLVAWVFFRADSFTSAQAVLAGMAGVNGVIVPSDSWLVSLGAEVGHAPALQGDVFVWLAALLTICWATPNTYELFHRYSPVLDHPLINEPLSRGARLMAKVSPELRGWFNIPALAVVGGTALIIVLARGNYAKDFIYMVF